MRRKVLLAAVAVVAILGLTAPPASAITHGVPDGEGHPYVGIMVAQTEAGDPLWRCSGTLISPTVFLTAGHCTFGAGHVEIWFQSDLTQDRAGYPFTGQVGGTPYTHPDYDDNAFYLADVGVVVLDTPVVRAVYGQLPAVDQLDELADKRGQKDLGFTAVGYGLQKSFPDAASWKDQRDLIRMVSTPKLTQINVKGTVGDYALQLSNNAKTGGTCSGDSGGPNFLGTSNVVAAVTSYGLNPTCAGVGGVYRMDRAVAQDWVKGFLN